LDLLFKDGVQPDRHYEYVQYELIQKFNEYVEQFGKKNGRMLKHLMDQDYKYRLTAKLDEMHGQHNKLVQRFFSDKVDLTDDNLYTVYTKMSEELKSMQVRMLKTIDEIKTRNGYLNATCCHLHCAKVKLLNLDYLIF